MNSQIESVAGFASQAPRSPRIEGGPIERDFIEQVRELAIDRAAD